MLFCLETCVTQLKVEKITSSILQKENDINHEQVDSNNSVVNSEDSKKKLLVIIDSNEAEALKINADEAQLNEAGVIYPIPSHKNQTVVATISDSTSTHENTKKIEGEANVAQIDLKNTEHFIVKAEDNEIKQNKCLDNLDTDAEVKEKTSKTYNDKEEQEDKKKVIKVKDVIPETNEDEDDIQDEELDHEIDEELDHEINEELDHEVDEEEKNDSTDDINQANIVSLYNFIHLSMIIVKLLNFY